MIAAATRLKESWETAMRSHHEGDAFTDADVIEMHEAALGLIWATNTNTLEQALEVLLDYDS
jgi:hypothetical protein